MSLFAPGSRAVTASSGQPHSHRPSGLWLHDEGDRKTRMPCDAISVLMTFFHDALRDVGIDSIWEDRKDDIEEMFCNCPAWGVIFDR
jgi:hypothetical protein